MVKESPLTVDMFWNFALTSPFSETHLEAQDWLLEHFFYLVATAPDPDRSHFQESIIEHFIDKCVAFVRKEEEKSIEKVPNSSSNSLVTRSISLLTRFIARIEQTNIVQDEQIIKNFIKDPTVEFSILYPEDNPKEYKIKINKELKLAELKQMISYYIKVDPEKFNVVSYRGAERSFKTEGKETMAYIFGTLFGIF